MASPGTVEIVVLGKGVGESIVVRLDDKWVVVDSFKAPRPADGEMEAAPLTYLRGRGVKVAEEVSAVVLTHIHDDHYQGIDQVVQACSSATFYVPAAVPDDQWDQYFRIQSRATRRSPAVADVVAAYRTTRRHRFQPIGATTVLATQRQELFAIAPSVRAQNAARAAFAASDEDAVRAIRRQNCTSIVLWLSCDGAVALLAGDMERDDDVGWEPLLEEHQNQEWLAGAKLVKIAHHGSKTGHHPDVYARWTSEPVGIVTPNTRGANGLPRDEMIEPLKDVCRSLWLAGPPKLRPIGQFDTEGPSRVYAAVAVCARDGSGEWDLSKTDPDLEL